MSDPRPNCTQCSVVNDTVCVHHLVYDMAGDADAFRERAERAEASLATLIACIRVAERRGWHHMQLDSVTAAAEAAELTLTRSTSDPPTGPK